MTDFGHAIGLPAQAGPDIATVHAKARARAEVGDLTGARTMIEEALAGGELRLGRDDPSLVPLMVDLATLARRLGNLTEARNQLRRAYDVIVAASGPEHPTSLAVQGRLSAIEYRLGEPTDAYDRHLVDVGTRVLGPEHPAVRGAQQRLTNAAQAAAGTAAPPAYAAPPAFAAPPTVAAPPAYAAPPSFAAPEAFAAPVAFAGPPDVAPEAVATPPSVTAPAEPAPPAPTLTPEVIADPLTPVGGAALAVAGPYGPALEGDIWVPAAEDRTVRTARRPGRGTVLLVVSLTLVLVIGGALAALQLLLPEGGLSAPGPVSGQSGSATPTASGPPAPTGIRLTDEGGTLIVSWVDPSNGIVPFVVSGARQGYALSAIETVPAGQTSTTIYGLNVNYDYCFTVAAVWSADIVRESIRTCTHRILPTASA